MEWKKEKISAAELERSRREYMSAAMNMMKRSDTSTHTEAPAEPTEPAPAVEVTHTAEITQTAEVTQTVEIAPSAVTEPAEEAPETTEAPETSETSEAAPAAEEPTEPAPDEECEQAEEPSASGDKYGVYTAEELLKADRSDDGLKKAAEILEEMTRNTAIMKRLAADADDTDTTDFPDFSCDTDDDCSFRDGYRTDSASEQLTETDAQENE